MLLSEERVTTPDDRRLLSDLRVGRPCACAALVRAYYAAVYRLLAHLTRDAHLAEDLTQETFAAAWQKLPEFAERSSLGTWLHRIAYTKFIDAQRAHQRAVKMREERQPPQGGAPDPHDIVAADDEARRLYAALDQLETAERTAVVLHYLQGLSYRQMADVLDEPAGTVKWRTAAALAHLRNLLADEVDDHASRPTPQS